MSFRRLPAFIPRQKKKPTVKSLAKQVKGLQGTEGRILNESNISIDGVTLTANVATITEIASMTAAAVSDGSRLLHLRCFVTIQGLAAGAVASHCRFMVIRDNDATNATAIATANILVESTPWAAYYASRNFPTWAGIKKNNKNFVRIDHRHEILYDKMMFLSAAGGDAEDRMFMIDIPLHGKKQNDVHTKYYYFILSPATLVCDVQETLVYNYIPI